MTSRSHRALLGFLAAGALSLPLLTAAGAAPAAKGDPKAGKAAFKSEGCTGCHKTKDMTDGGSQGPDLKEEGKKPAAEITKFIQHPKSGSVMPAFKGPAKTLSNLVAYLQTQK